MAYRYLRAERNGGVEWLTLNRPEVRNALNDEVIAELAAWTERTRADRDVRAVIVRGAGAAFCAGADVNWMSGTIELSEEENLRDAAALSRMFAGFDSLPVPTICRIHGAALGGGVGLAAVCDIVVCEEQAVFGFTEVKLGIVPAVISPFVLAKIGRSAARELFLTGMRFSAARSREIGLVHAVVQTSQLDAKVGEYVQEILSAGPESVATAKHLIADVWGRPLETAEPITTKTIASRRVSPEGQEGLRAFLEKRAPSWRHSPTPGPAQPSDVRRE